MSSMWTTLDYVQLSHNIIRLSPEYLTQSAARASQLQQEIDAIMAQDNRLELQRAFHYADCDGIKQRSNMLKEHEANEARLALLKRTMEDCVAVGRHVMGSKEKHQAYLDTGYWNKMCSRDLWIYKLLVSNPCNIQNNGVARAGPAG